MANEPLKRTPPISASPRSVLGNQRVNRALQAEEALRTARASEDLVVAEVAEPSEIGFWRLAVIRFLHHRTATISPGILLFISVTALLVPVFQGDLYRFQDYTHPYGQPFLFHSKAISLAG